MNTQEEIRQRLLQELPPLTPEQEAKIDELLPMIVPLFENSTPEQLQNLIDVITKKG